MNYFGLHSFCCTCPQILCPKFFSCRFLDCPYFCRINYPKQLMPRLLLNLLLCYNVTITLNKFLNNYGKKKRQVSTSTRFINVSVNLKKTLQKQGALRTPIWNSHLNIQFIPWVWIKWLFWTRLSMTLFCGAI